MNTPDKNRIIRDLMLYKLTDCPDKLKPLIMDAVITIKNCVIPEDEK